MIPNASDDAHDPRSTDHDATSLDRYAAVDTDECHCQVHPQTMRGAIQVVE